MVTEEHPETETPATRAASAAEESQAKPSETPATGATESAAAETSATEGITTSENMGGNNSPLSDAQLREWREAATSGGFPQPYLERWQPLRAGVVNLWEFDVAEYWYAGGWAQLTGRNETGKSSLMALTTLIPWLADTSSDKIDTLGRSGKQFSYYVRPTGKGADRRETVAGVSHGWLWVEYGRMGEAGSEFFTTLLYAASRDATQKVALTWGTCEGARVREGLVLAHGLDVNTAKMVEAATPGYVNYPTAAAYKNALANTLLDGNVEKLEMIGKILKVTRTPKLGAQLEVRFISDQLRAALPPLRRQEIDALAQGWDQLDKMRQDVELTKQAASAITGFVRRRWVPWKQAVLRLHADQVASRQTEFDQVTKDENEAKARLEASVARETALVDELTAARIEREATSERIKALLESAVFQEATQRIAAAENAKREATRQAAAAREAGAATAEKEADFERAGAHLETARTSHEKAAAGLAETERDLRRRAREVGVEARETQVVGAGAKMAGTAESTGIGVAGFRAAGDVAAAGTAGVSRGKSGAGEIDGEWLDQALVERGRVVKQGLGLAKMAGQQAAAATLAEKRADDAREAATGARNKAEIAWGEAEKLRDNLVLALREWAEGTIAEEGFVVPFHEVPSGDSAKRREGEPAPHEAENAPLYDKLASAKTLVESWIDTLPTRVGDSGAAESASEDGAVDAAEAKATRAGGKSANADTRLGALARELWFEPRRGRLTETRRELHAREKETSGHISELSAKIAELENTQTQPPTAPSLWSRRERTGQPGAPLWRLLNPVAQGSKDGAHESLAAVEAALAAMGLLDAWVDAQGVPKELDTFVMAPHETGTKRDQPNLSSILSVADEAGELAPTVQKVLEAIAWVAGDAPLPEGAAAIAADGRWQMGTLSGQAASAHGHSEWIGEAAREAQRRRLIAGCEAQRAELIARREALREALLAVEAQVKGLEALWAGLPNDSALRETLVRAETLDGAAGDLEEQAARVETEAASARAAADSAAAEVLNFCNAHSLPAAEEELLAYRGDITAVQGALQLWVRERAEVSRLDEVVAAAAAEAQLRDDALTSAREKQRQAEEAARKAQVFAEELARSIEADDSALLQQKESLEAREVELREREDTLGASRSEVAWERGQAEAQLAHCETRRREAADSREKAIAGFRRIVEQGMASNIGLELEDAEADTIQGVRAQCAQIRREVTPRSWNTSANTTERHEANLRLMNRARNAIKDAARDLRTELLAGGRELTIHDDEDGELLRALVRVDAQGREEEVDQAVATLGAKVAEIEALYDEKVRETLDQLLGSTFLEHMRTQIAQSQNLIKSINKVLSEHRTATDKTTLHIALVPDQNVPVVEAITGSRLVDPEVERSVREFLREKVDEAKRSAEDAGVVEWGDTLADLLDYRSWFDIRLERRFGAGQRSPLTARSFSELSGGARAIMVMAPLLAALSALYREIPLAPHPLWLDEAFDGLDAANRSMVMSMLRSFDLDVLVVGPGHLVNVAAVPLAAIYQVIRAPEPLPGASLTLALWSGNSLEHLTYSFTPPSLGGAGGAGGDEDATGGAGARGSGHRATSPNSGTSPADGMLL